MTDNRVRTACCRAAHYVVDTPKNLGKRKCAWCDRPRRMGEFLESDTIAGDVVKCVGVHEARWPGRHIVIAVVDGYCVVKSPTNNSGYLSLPWNWTRLAK